MAQFILCYAECHYAECRYAECRYAECRGANISERVVKFFKQSCQIGLRRRTRFNWLHK